MSGPYTWPTAPKGAGTSKSWTMVCRHEGRFPFGAPVTFEESPWTASSAAPAMDRDVTVTREIWNIRPLFPPVSTRNLIDSHRLVLEHQLRAPCNVQVVL